MARMRWRRLWRVTIQELLTATIQNIAVLVRYARSPRPIALAAQGMPSDPTIFMGRGRFDPFFGSETCF